METYQPMPDVTPGPALKISKVGDSHRLETEFGTIELMKVHVPLAPLDDGKPRSMWLTYAWLGSLEATKCLAYVGTMKPEYADRCPISEDKELLAKLALMIGRNMANVVAKAAGVPAPFPKDSVEMRMGTLIEDFVTGHHEADMAASAPPAGA